jgi:hypothetical protein
LHGSDAETDIGYRVLSWNFSNGSGTQQFRSSMMLYGPLAGLTVHF